MPTNKLHFAIFGNTFHNKKADVLQQVIQTIDQYAESLSVEEEFYRFMTSELRIALPSASCFVSDAFPSHTDVAISFGGDGTFLKTAALIGASGIPVLGINAGRLGFLADISPNEVNLACRALCDKTFVVEDRTLISVMAGDTELTVPSYALNDVAVLKHDNSSTISIYTEVDGEELTHYIADGLILSTPSGSTGYSLSVGGPLLAPGVNAFVLAPVAPHSLNIRPIVLNDSVTIKLKVESRNHNYLVAIDGRNQSLSQATELTLRKAPFTLKVIKLKEKTYFKTLRNKLMWGADQRQ